jgi:hypothetical protein
MTSSAGRLFCKPTKWHGRNGYVLGNSLVRLITLTGGGHIAEFQLEQSPGVNPLWLPPWKTIEPQSYHEKVHKPRYGTITEGKLLSGIVGHNICLDYFGSPSAEESQVGLSQHGEAASSLWRKLAIDHGAELIALKLSVQLPVAGLRFTRKIELRKEESVAYITEVVENRRKADHFFHWTQHVTLGPEFLVPGEASISLPGTRGITDPTGYEGATPLLNANEEFSWPHAPSLSGERVDLRSPFIRKGCGFVVGVLLDKTKEIGFVTAVNRKLGLLIAYCFRREDFPWVAIWEENRGIAAPPWNGETQARGLEFSTTPLPMLRRDSFLAGRLFGEATLTWVPARASRTVRYLALLGHVPRDFDAVHDVTVNDRAIHVQGSGGQQLTIPSSARSHLSKQLLNSPQ